MSAPAQSNSQFITSKSDLIHSLSDGCSPKKDWRIGTEHEKFPFCWDKLSPIAYDSPSKSGIKQLLTGLEQKDIWAPVYEGENIIALKGMGTQKGASITLEPGGQLELSGAPLETIHQTCSEVHEHLDLVRQVADPMNIGMLGIGFIPQATRDQIPWMPKGRYKIMRDYMPKKGSMGLDMMLRTCTVQVNLDFASEADMVKKMRVSVALQPFATALFANSPFKEGKLSGYASTRSHVWSDTDPDRCGMLPFVFEEGFGFERWVDYLLDTPMYFVYRDGTYIDAAGQSFRDFMQGQLPALPGEKPTMGDWQDHMTTVFPEVRLKQYIEMRGADGGSWRHLCALPAFWVGLLYDTETLDAAWDLCKDWTEEERLSLRLMAAEKGLKAEFRGRSLADWSLEILKISQEGLRKRRRLDGMGNDEQHYLHTLFQRAEKGNSLADDFREKFETEWGHSIAPLYKEFAY